MNLRQFTFLTACLAAIIGMGGCGYTQQTLSSIESTTAYKASAKWAQENVKPTNCHLVYGRELCDK